MCLRADVKHALDSGLNSVVNEEVLGVFTALRAAGGHSEGQISELET